MEKEKKNLLRLIAEEEKYVCKIDRDQIVYWLTKFKDGNIEDENFKRIIIDLMVNSVTVWDEPDGFRITTAYNLTSCKNKTFRIPSSSDKGFGFEGLESCSAVRADCVEKAAVSGLSYRKTGPVTRPDEAGIPVMISICCGPLTVLWRRTPPAPWPPPFHPAPPHLFEAPVRT